MQAHPTLYRIHYHGGQSSKGNPLYSFERLDPASADGDAVHATPPVGTMPAMLALPAPPVHATPTPAPAHGGGGVDAWTVDDVAAYLQRLELGHKVDLVRDIGLDGTMLLEAIQNGELEEMGFSKFQARKIVSRLP